eukprot:m.545515 g.545515  ORF g.545515 m.545515 type:complete len:84 (-) comp57673_c0_seq5:1493-1744(-)
MTASSLFLLLACVATAALAAPILHLGAAADDDNADPSFDHQTATYTVYAAGSRPFALLRYIRARYAPHCLLLVCVLSTGSSSR